MPSSIPIRACPSCGALFQSPKREAPPFFEAYHPTEEHVRATKCRACDRFFWVEDAPFVGDLPLDKAHPVFDVTLVSAGPDARAVEQALARPEHRAVSVNRTPVVVALRIGRGSAESIAEICRALGATMRIDPSRDDPQWAPWRAAPKARKLTRLEAVAALDAGEATTAMRHNYLVRLTI